MEINYSVHPEGRYLVITFSDWEDFNLLGVSEITEYIMAAEEQNESPR